MAIGHVTIRDLQIIKEIPDIPPKIQKITIP